MKLGFCSLASGSSGNCYLIKSDNTNLLLDAGISCKAIQAGLESLGISLKDIDGIFITHDHIDHIKGIKTLLKKTSCPLYASRELWKLWWRRSHRFHMRGSSRS